MALLAEAWGFRVVSSHEGGTYCQLYGGHGGLRGGHPSLYGRRAGRLRVLCHANAPLGSGRRRLFNACSGMASGFWALCRSRAVDWWDKETCGRDSLSRQRRSELPSGPVERLMNDPCTCVFTGSPMGRRLMPAGRIREPGILSKNIPAGLDFVPPSYQCGRRKGTKGRADVT